MSEFKPRIVECIQRRDGGTHITFDACDRWPKGAYHFRPGLMRDGRHADTIGNEAHYERLLSLPEAFRPVHADDLIAAPSVAAAAPQSAPAAPPPADNEGGEGDQNPDTWDAAKVLALGVNKIIALAKGFTDEQLRQLIDLEGQRKDPRESLIKSLTGTLRNREAP
jgi:hypothetical protein